jgi:hypothetical protein
VDKCLGDRTFRTQGQDALATYFQTVPVWFRGVWEDGLAMLFVEASGSQTILVWFRGCG